MMTLSEPGVADLSSVDMHGHVSPIMRSPSAPMTISEEDDEDMRIIRRLMCRKIESLTSDAWDELEKVVCWLRIIKEVIRGVKRRAYL